MKLFSAFNPALGSSLGVSALPRDTLACSQSEMGIKQPILGSLDSTKWSELKQFERSARTAGQKGITIVRSLRDRPDLCDIAHMKVGRPSNWFYLYWERQVVIKEHSKALWCSYIYCLDWMVKLVPHPRCFGERSITSCLSDSLI